MGSNLFPGFGDADIALSQVNSAILNIAQLSEIDLSMLNNNGMVDVLGMVNFGVLPPPPLP